ncbi:hypothetical protein DFP73DRAFT_530831 [Morchella snyderi]|nr:hypothetical protein DFP73DRAFT_530831 [Morchella snyderi]
MDGGPASAIPQLQQMDKNQILHRIGLEEESPPAEDLLRHILSIFASQDPSSSPAKAIISLLLGFISQIDTIMKELAQLPPVNQSPPCTLPPGDLTPLPPLFIHEEINHNDPIETIDAHGNRRLLSYAEKVRMPTNQPARPSATAPSPSTQNTRLTANTSSKPSANLPTTQQRFFAMRNGTVTCTAFPSTPVKHIAAYFPGLLAVLNLACQTTKNPFNEFQLAPTNTDYAIHNVPLFALHEQQDLLIPTIAEAVSLATGVSISSARFLSKPENREGKATTFIVISVTAKDVEKIGAAMRLCGRPCRCNKL